jgi:hypothetical protein
VPTTADLKAVTFSDARHGCIVGDAQEILVTADRGAGHRILPSILRSGLQPSRPRSSAA